MKKLFALFSLVVALTAVTGCTQSDQAPVGQLTPAQAQVYKGQ